MLTFLLLPPSPLSRFYFFFFRVYHSYSSEPISPVSHVNFFFLSFFSYSSRVPFWRSRPSRRTHISLRRTKRSLASLLLVPPADYPRDRPSGTAEEATGAKFPLHFIAREGEPHCLQMSAATVSPPADASAVPVSGRRETPNYARYYKHSWPL